MPLSAHRRCATLRGRKVAALYLDYHTRLFVSILVFVYIRYIPARGERGRKGLKGKERKREVEWLRETASPVCGEEKGRRGTQWQMVFYYSRWSSRYLPRSSKECCLVKSFSNIFSPRSSCFLYIYIYKISNYIQPKLLSQRKKRNLN